MKGINDRVECSVPIARRPGVTKLRRPTIDLGACSRCGGCVEVAPEIFRFSESAGYVEIRELSHYEPEAVEEAMKWCPENCIYWDEDR